jgi:xanthine/uracil permease
VVSVVFLLIGFTLLPTVIALLAPPEPVPAPAGVIFALILIFAMFAGQRWLPAVWKSTVIFLAMIVGSAAWLMLFGDGRNAAASVPMISYLPGGLTVHPIFIPGVLIAFLICFVGLSINDLGSIESLSTLLGPSNMSRRINRGIALTGLANLASGFLGVVGPVNFSLSPGVIMSTGSGSRFTLVPTSILLGLVSFSPYLMSFIAGVPSVVAGSIFVYVLTFQVAAGLAIISRAQKRSRLKLCLVIGLPVLLGTIVSFIPAQVFARLPASLRPIVGNGFVMGVLTAFVLDRAAYGSGSDQEQSL